MKKKITALALLLALLLTLCGCGKSEAVKNTEKLIGEIGTVTVDSVSAVEAAEAAYNALSDEERSQVSNAKVLTAARETLDRALLDALRASLIGAWETQVNVRDGLAAEMDGQFSGSDLTFADYLDECSLTFRLELGEDGTYRLTLDPACLTDVRQTVHDAVTAFVSDYLLFFIAKTLEESGVQGDFSTREGIEAAVGMDLGELIRDALGMDLEVYIDQVCEEVDPEKLFSGMEGEGRFTVAADELFFSADTEHDPNDAATSFSLTGDVLTVSIPADALFPLTGTCVFKRAG